MESKLRRVLGRLDILFIAFGAMIGWSWVVNVGIWIEGAGVIGAVIAFILGGVMVYFVSLTYAELTAAIPESGGEFIFTRRALGSTCSFICAWALLLAYIGVVAFEACAFSTVVSYLFPGIMRGYMYTIAGFDIYATWVAIGVGATVIITAVNIAGTKISAIFERIFVILIFLAGLLIVIIGLAKGSPENVTTHMFAGNNLTDKTSVGGILTIVAMTPFLLVGFDVIPQIAPESNIPYRKLGQIIIVSVLMAVLFYSIIIVATGFGASKEFIVESNGSQNGLIVSDMLAALMNSPVIGKLVILGGLAGIVTSWNSFMIGASRVLFAVSEKGLIPATFSKISGKRGVPVNAILLVGAVTVAAPFFGRRMLVWITDAGGFGTVVAYLLVGISFLRLRKTEPDLYRPYKLKNGRFIGSLAILFSGLFALLYIVPLPFADSMLNKSEFTIVGLWIVCGIVLYVISKKKKSRDRSADEKDS